MVEQESGAANSTAEVPADAEISTVEHTAKGVLMGVERRSMPVECHTCPQPAQLNYHQTFCSYFGKQKELKDTF